MHLLGQKKLTTNTYCPCFTTFFPLFAYSYSHTLQGDEKPEVARTKCFPQNHLQALQWQPRIKSTTSRARGHYEQKGRRGRKTLKCKKKWIGGLTSGHWGGLGNYLWELTLENNNWAERRREWATQCIVRGRPS